MKNHKMKWFLAGIISVLIFIVFVFGSSSNFLGAFHLPSGDTLFSTPKECGDGIDNDSDGSIDLGGCDCNDNEKIETQLGSSTALRVSLCEAGPMEKVAGYDPWCKFHAGVWYEQDENCSTKMDDSEDLDHCSDELYNEGEEGLDCGGTCSNECEFVEKCGYLISDETWSGNIYASCTVEVQFPVILTIEPGTIVKFKYDRDYKTQDRAGLQVRYGGTLIAQGTKDKQIWFTSAAEDPINGDWDGIIIEDSDDSMIDYVIVEFGEMGIAQFDSSVPITNSIVRWSNAEGLYAERSEPLFENNLLYGNGYHEIALEQYNDARTINNIFKNGHNALHNEETENYIAGNCFSNEEDLGISAGMESSLEVINNYFQDIPNPFDIYDDATINEDYLSVNHIDSKAFICPALDFEDIQNHELSYVPGDLEDEYPYIYDDEDETRRVLTKIGEDLSFGWALEYEDGYLYRFNLGDGEIGESPDFIKINAETGEYERFGNNEIINPRGLTYDGEYFYVNDFSLLKIFKFKLEEGEDFITIYDSFDIPEPELGGTDGLTTDGEYLYLRNRYRGTIDKLTKEGVWVDDLHIPGGTIVWTGDYFWTTNSCDKGLCKYTYEGELVGEIYPPAKDTWAITWDGEHLWTLQRTCEGWNDPKIYEIEILDDSLTEE